MAKGLRSKARKSNKAALRARVFEPAERLRKERLSSKLQELSTRTPKEVLDDANASQ